MRACLEEGGFTAFTDTFENLHGMKQLPGIATQRLMASGYGFGGEGDWKTAALVRTMKVMDQFLKAVIVLWKTTPIMLILPIPRA